MSNKAKVVFIDDDPMHRMYFQSSFSSKYEILLLKDGTELTEELIDSFNPDVIVTDYDMPNEDGRTMILRHYEQNLLQYVPIIIFSGKIDLNTFEKINKLNNTSGLLGVTFVEKGKILSTHQLETMILICSRLREEIIKRKSLENQAN